MDFKGTFLSGTDTLTLKKSDFSKRLEFTSPDVADDIFKEEAVNGLLPVCAHTLEHGRWASRRFLTDSPHIRIGSRIGKSDIVVEGPYIEEVQVSLQIFGGKWFIIESGIYNLLSVNGIRTRQATLCKWGSCFIQIGNIPVVVSIPQKLEYDSEGRLQKMEEKEPKDCFFSIHAKGRPPVKFPKGRTVLLGASESCDFRVDSEEFSAVIATYEDRLYLCPFFNPAEFIVDGKPSERLQPLGADSAIAVGSSSMKVELLKEAPQDSQPPPNMLAVEICLLELDDDSNPGKVIALPSPGEIVSFGRTTESTVCIQSPNISKEHARAKINSTNIAVQDSYSRNGTFLNGERIEKRTAKPGDILRFADRSFLVSFIPIDKCHI